MKGSSLRRITVGLLSTVTALAVTFSQAGPARAADSVFDGRCQDTTTSLGKICVYVWFDNTNCDNNSLTNCSGLNGADITKIEIATESGSIAETDVAYSLDTYGDRTTEYSATYRTRFFWAGPGNSWVTRPSRGFRGDINRVCVRVRSAAASGTSGVNIGGMNPYGLSQAGSCGLS